MDKEAVSLNPVNRGAWALGAADGLRDDERGVLQSLGAAVVARWSELPRDIQKRLFETAAHGSTDTDPDGLRGHLARFLHDCGNRD
jgi:hypothetical protein